MGGGEGISTFCLDQPNSLGGKDRRLIDILELLVKIVFRDFKKILFKNLGCGRKIVFQKSNNRFKLFGPKSHRYKLWRVRRRLVIIVYQSFCWRCFPFIICLTGRFLFDSVKI